MPELPRSAPIGNFPDINEFQDMTSTIHTLIDASSFWVEMAFL